MKICFVCHANICRSFSAERILTRLAQNAGRKDIEVISRGIYASASYSVPDKIKNFLSSCSANAENHTSTLISAQDLKECDIILTMSQDQLDTLLDMAPQYTGKMFLFLDYAEGLEQDMPDPISKTGRAFDAIMTRLKTAVEHIFKKL